jgi:hypothetical protein
MTLNVGNANGQTSRSMPVGHCQREFGEAAAEDGIVLTAQSFPWLSQQGHLALPDGPARELLEHIYLALGGDLYALGTARSTALRGDYVHEPTGTLIEIDESQHFTTARLTTLDAGTALGFDLYHYKRQCRKLRAQSDRYRASKEALGFGPGGRARQRAYYDALRDLAAPALGHPPLVRIDAPHGNGRAAYRAHRERLATLLNAHWRRGQAR